MFSFDPVGADPADHALHLTAAFAGFAGYGLMVGTVVWGVLMALGSVRRHIRRETLYGGHMTMAIAALSFIVVHIVGNVARPAARLSFVEALAPFFHTGAPVATGVVSVELALVTAVSVWVQRRLGYRTWQTIHWLGYPAYGFAIVHVVLAGSDVRRPLIEISLGVSVAVVAVLAALRSLSFLRGRLVSLEA